MRPTIARIGALGTGALIALGLFAAAPAGASGSAGHGVNSADSTCFTAGDHTQGRSHSDPDGMSNGGADKPGCPGGFDADQDGNNGCGNDADREDDNNGRCGRQRHGVGNAPDDDANGNGADVRPENVDADVAVHDAGSAHAAGVPAADTPTTTTTAPASVL